MAGDQNSKKRKASLKPDTNTKEKAAKVENGGNNSDANADYEPLTLADIRVRILQLCKRVPVVPVDGLKEEEINPWASQLQSVIEEFNLLLCCISAATYKWSSDRSGAADQNLSTLSGELANAQDQIQSSVMPRLTNVLAPVVDLVLDRVETSTCGKVKHNFYKSQNVDEEFLALCRTILCRNAALLRQVVLANFTMIDSCIGDYLNAQLKDSQHDSRGFAY